MVKKQLNFSDHVSRPYISGGNTGGGILTLGAGDIDFIETPARGLLVEVSGPVNFHLVGDDPADIQTFLLVPAYTEFRGFLIDKVIDSGTTAARIHALF